MKLVIVESPTKCKTIKKYLGNDFEVMASCGHIRDLSTKGKGGLGVDVENNFKPSYENSKDKSKVISELKAMRKKAEEVYLATDPDREGEAISWHLCEVLGLDVDSTKRLEFHEITKPAIIKALENPRVIDMSLVQSQETRRIIDRIMGFKLSTLLKNKIGSISAGRVQSVTLKLITDREKEISEFIPREYWNLDLDLENGMNVKYDGSVSGEDKTISNQEMVEDIESNIKEYCVVSSLVNRTRRLESKPPFTTSTLQQEAYLKHHYSTKKTQSIAQKLYEGIDIGNETIGLITYMRTDSIRLSPEFINNAIEYIKDNYGENYVGKENIKKPKGMVQDAHEAIRPTSLNLDPKSIKQYLTNDEYNLYSLIYKRALASLMSSKVEDVTQVKMTNGDHLFKCEGVITVFDGYSKLYETSEKTENSKALPKDLHEGKLIKVIKINKEQKFTQPPARFNEAKLVKTMEELGIGRPSTYASTISTLKTRKYVNSEKGVFTPTEQGVSTVENLKVFFSPFMDTTYTSNMEKQLDEIVDGNNSRLNLLDGFYTQFNDLYQVAIKEMSKAKPVETGELCPTCGSPLVVKKSKFGEFIACSNFPTCHYVKPKEIKKLEVLDNEVCPKCGKELVKRTSKNGDFFACSGFPKCRYIKGQEEQAPKQDVVSDINCPKCGKPLLIKKGRNNKGDFLACSGFPKCRHIQSIK